MRKLTLIGLVIILLVLAGRVVSKNQKIDVDPTPIPTYAPEPSEIPYSTPIDVYETPPPPEKGIVIGPGESAEVQCGEGNDGIRTEWKGKGGGNTTLNGQIELIAKLLDAKLQPAKGALIKWSLYDWGTLRIDRCKATFTAPDSIGMAYSSSATISTRVVTSPPPSPTSGGGEGGPINAGYSSSARITIYAGGSNPTCFDPEGVSVSINSVSTYRNVQIEIDTPRVIGRLFNGRVATVRDGPGTYYINFYVDGVLYDSTTSQVAKCRLETVKR